MEGMICIGQYDADELKEMNEDPKFQAMLGVRIHLDGSGGYDKGCIWALEGDGEAYEMACKYAF